MPTSASIAPNLVNEDCLTVLPTLPDDSFDLVILDLPYNCTGAAWDTKIDLRTLWKDLRRVITPTGTILAFGTQPFSTKLATPAIDLLKYGLVWEKTKPTQHFHASNRPLSGHEDILVFSRGVCIHPERSERRMTYNPVGSRSGPSKLVAAATSEIYKVWKGTDVGAEFISMTDVPRSVLKHGKDGKLHASQKPLALVEWLIAAYSNEGDMVLDPAMGSGTTIIAAARQGRECMGIERDPDIFSKAEARIEAELA